MYVLYIGLTEMELRRRELKMRTRSRPGYLVCNYTRQWVCVVGWSTAIGARQCGSSLGSSTFRSVRGFSGLLPCVTVLAGSLQIKAQMKNWWMTNTRRDQTKERGNRHKQAIRSRSSSVTSGRLRWMSYWYTVLGRLDILIYVHYIEFVYVHLGWMQVLETADYDYHSLQKVLRAAYWQSCLHIY